MSKNAGFGALYTYIPEKPRLITDTSQTLEETSLQLEDRLCRVTGAEHCVPVPELGTGIYLALRSLGIGRKDRVLCSGLATEEVVQSILRTGGAPMLVDINPNTFTIDPYCLEYAIGKCLRTETPLPKALVASDTFGLPCPYEAIEGICRKHGIALIQDMGESLGGSVGSRQSGGFGRYSVMSFALEAACPEDGEGGAILCRDPADAGELRQMMAQYERVQDPVQAAAAGWTRAQLALGKLEDHPQHLAARQRAAEQYCALFSGQLRCQQIPAGYTSACSRFPVALPVHAPKLEIVSRLREKDIICDAIGTNVRKLPRDDWERVMLLNAESARQKLITIPMHPFLTTRLTDYIAAQIMDEIHCGASLE